MREVEALLEKAERSFAAADRYSRHGQEVVAQYGRHFASEGRLDRRYHRFLGRAFELRQLADYAVEVDVDPALVSELIKGGGGVP